MGITNITSISDIEYQTRQKTTKDLTNKIENQKHRSSANLENSNNQQEKFKSSTEFYGNFLKKQNDTSTIKCQRYSDIRRCFNMVILLIIKT